jgi:hypothetical protein
MIKSTSCQPCRWRFVDISSIPLDLRSANTFLPTWTVRLCYELAACRADGVQLLTMNASGTHCCCALNCMQWVLGPVTGGTTQAFSDQLHTATWLTAVHPLSKAAYMRHSRISANWRCRPINSEHMRFGERFEMLTRANKRATWTLGCII